MHLNASAMLASIRVDTSLRWSSMLTQTTRLPSLLTLQRGITGHYMFDNSLSRQSNLILY